MFKNIPPEIVAGVGGGLVVLLVLMIIFRYLLRICRPNEILIFSGRKHTAGDGRTVGYRVVFGGRGVRVPVVETVDRMDVSLISVPMAVTGAYSEGGIPLNMHAIANIKVSTDRRFIGNAIERFLGKPRTEIARVVKETLEGHLRGVLATLTPEEVNEDRLKFARRLEESAKSDLDKLGLELDVLKIQHVADDRNYLESIGRQRIAEILRGAEVAESDAARLAEQSEAGARARGEIAMTNAQAAVQRKQNELRQIKAEVDSEARAEEVRAEAAGQQARAEAELQLQQIRGELEGLRLEADVKIPAEIDQQVRQLFAAGNAAPIAADGEAMAMALEEVSSAWRDSGGRAMDMFVLQHLDAIFGSVAEAASRVKVGEVNLIDGGDGKTLPSYVASYPATMGALLQQVTATLGIDIGRVITGTSTTAPSNSSNPAGMLQPARS
ncbi:MAG: SPFH domain-containing protein [Proteobacteria bacterium]|nr:SPFH domain-containing protein [Pseudomonadota bacterium]